MARLFWICLGGAFGTGARYGVATWVQSLTSSAFPYGTLAVNLLGSFLIALLVHLTLASDAVSPTLRLALTTGVMGGFTTYSTFSHETMQLVLKGAYGLALLDILVTVTTCLAACFLGLALGRWLAGG